MLQGVVDCFWDEPEGLVILDFKTDRIHGDLDATTGRSGERPRRRLPGYPGLPAAPACRLMAALTDPE